MNKKGALELSITAIVVLIIAITVLGLAIFFIKNLFGGATEIFTGEFSKIKETLKTNLEESGEALAFSIGSELELRKGERKDFYIAVLNSASDHACYQVAVFCLRPFSSTNEVCNADEGLVGGKFEGQEATTNKWFPKLLDTFDIPGGETAVNPITLQIANAPADTYLMEIKVFRAASEQSEGDPCDSPGEFREATSKRFHIVLR